MKDKQIKVIKRYKHFTPFADCISEINNAQVYSENYSNQSGHLWQYFRDEPSYILTDSESFGSRVKITLKTSDDGNTMGVEITIPSKYLSNFLENSRNAFN